MKIRFYYFMFLVSMLFVACNSNDPNPINPTNPLIGKVKKLTTTNTSSNSLEFYYNSTGILDSTIFKDSSRNINTTIRYFFYGNNVVSKNFNSGVTNNDSTIFYTNGTRLDSIVQYQSSNKLLKTYHYDGNGVLIYFKNYLNNPTALPTNTTYSSGNLLRTDYTYDTGPYAFNSDTSNYSYNSTVSNLTPSAFGVNFNGIFEFGAYQLTNSTNLVTDIDKHVAIGNTNNPTIIRAYSQTNIIYQFDTQNRVIVDTRNTTNTNSLGGSPTTEIVVYNFEYY